MGQLDTGSLAKESHRILVDVSCMAQGCSVCFSGDRCSSLGMTCAAVERNKSKEILPEFTEGDSGDAGPREAAKSVKTTNTLQCCLSCWLLAFAGGVEVVMGNFQVQPLPHCRDLSGSHSRSFLLSPLSRSRCIRLAMEFFEVMTA